jgi:ribosomal protein S15P/S13E
MTDERHKNGTIEHRRSFLQRYSVLISIIGAWTLMITVAGVNTWAKSNSADERSKKALQVLEDRAERVNAVPHLKEDLAEHKQDFKDFRQEQRMVNSQVSAKLDYIVKKVASNG